MSFFRKRDGYTLMELLTVIAIIGVLAALIFPVAAGAKRRARQAQCMNNMYQIFTALKQFQLDEKRYPEFIAGPVQFRENPSDPNSQIVYSGSADQIVPLEKHTGMVGGSTGGNGRLISLYPEYITVINLLKCPFSDLNGDDNLAYTTGQVNPITTEPDIVADPMYTVLNSLGITDTFRAAQRYYLYKYSSYDYQKPLYRVDDQVHYSTAWSNDMANPNVTRQLRWRTPPEDTVISWCSHHRASASGGAPKPSSKDIFLFLDGHAKQISSGSIENATPNQWPETAWQITPQ